MDSVRILIADDHEIVRQGMRSLFSLRSNWEICGEAIDGLDAIEKAKELKPDVILLDISMPRLNGLDAARLIHRDVPQSEIIVVSQHDPAHMRPMALEAGAKGYVAKSNLSRDLLAAVEAVIPPSARSEGKGSATVAEPAKPTPPPFDETDKNFRMMANAVPVMLWVSGPDALLNFFNQAWVEFSGRTTEQEAGNGWTQSVHPDDVQRCVDVFSSSLRSRMPFQLEYRHRRVDGEYRWLLNRAAPRYGADGEFAGYIGSCTDITERRRAEEEVVRGRDSLRNFVEHAPAAIAMLDRDLRYLQASNRWLADFEMKRGDVVGRPVSDVLLGSAERWKLVSEQCLAGNVEKSDEERLTGPGPERWMRWEARPWRGTNNQVGGLLMFCEDITERRKADEAVWKLAAIVESSDDAIVSKDLKGVIQSWNGGAERIFGYTAAEAVGRSITLIIPERLWPEEKELLRRLQGGERIDHYETERLTKDGKEVFVSLTISPVRDAKGRIIGASKVARDITERKQAEEILRATQERLEARVRERTADLERAQEGLRSLSARLLQAQDEERRRIARELHDTAGQLLAALSMNLAPLEKELTGLSPQSASRLKDSIGLVDELSKDLRTISHLLHPPLLDEAGLVSAIRWYVEGFAERSQVDVELKLGPELGRLSTEMETTIFRLVQESLINIHRHSGSRTASVRLGRDAQSVQLEIKDQGRGLGRAEGAPHSPSQPARPGVGIQGMRERVWQLGGVFEVVFHGDGTTVRAEMPVKADVSAMAQSGTRTA